MGTQNGQSELACRQLRHDTCFRLSQFWNCCCALGRAWMTTGGVQVTTSLLNTPLVRTLCRLGKAKGSDAGVAAALHRHITLLINTGADLNARDETNWRPLDLPSALLALTRLLFLSVSRLMASAGDDTAMVEGLHHPTLVDASAAGASAQLGDTAGVVAVDQGAAAVQ